jgi:hypothetical protein
MREGLLWVGGGGGAGTYPFRSPLGRHVLKEEGRVNHHEVLQRQGPEILL